VLSSDLWERGTYIHMLRLLPELAGLRWFSPLLYRIMPKRLHRLYGDPYQSAPRSLRPPILPPLTSLTACVPLLEGFPLFPLGIVALPGEGVPLHIFEQRYRTMVAECLERSREFGIVWVGEEGSRPVGCAMEITEVLERMDDGRLNIVAVGGSGVGSALLRRVTASFPDAKSLVPGLRTSPARSGPRQGRPCWQGPPSAHV